MSQLGPADHVVDTENLKDRLDVAAQGFFYTRDPETKEIRFMLGYRNPKKYPEFPGLAPTGGMKERLRDGSLEGDDQTLGRECEEETDASELTRRQKLWKAATYVFRRGYWQSEKTGNLDPKAFREFLAGLGLSSLLKSVHSEIHFPDKADWYVTFDRFHAIELTADQFEFLRRHLEGRVMENEEVRHYEFPTATQLLRQMNDHGGFLSMSIEERAAVKFLESQGQGPSTLAPQVIRGKRPVFSPTPEMIEQGSRMISHGVRVLKQVGGDPIEISPRYMNGGKITVQPGEWTAQVLEFDGQGKNMVIADIYPITKQIRDEYHPIGTLSDGSTVYRKNADQAPVILLEGAIAVPSTIRQKDGTLLDVEPGTRLIWRYNGKEPLKPGEKPRFDNGDVEPLTPERLARDFTLLDLPRQYRDARPLFEVRHGGGPRRALNLRTLRAA